MSAGRRPSGDKLRVAVLGQVDGPIGGQSRLTQAFRDGSECRTIFFEFYGHKSGFGPFKLLWQFACAAWLAGGRADAAYIALSRTNFGMFRDIFLLLPFFLARTPVIAHVHGAEFDDFFLENPRFRAIKSFYLHNVSRFIFVNEVFMPDTPELARRSGFVRNPIPQFAVEAMARDSETVGKQAPQAPDRKCFGFISTFAREKGVELFLDAAERFAGHADFIVAGGPSMEDEQYGDEILKRIEAMPEVEYLGYLLDPTVFYERCDFMVFPTNFASETSSLVVIEALATRTHPIVRRHNQLTRVFKDAPISWFDDQDGLMQQVEAALAISQEDLDEMLLAAIPWVRSTFPSEAQWVEKVEIYVSDAARGHSGAA